MQTSKRCHKAMLPELRKLCCSVPKHKYLKVKKESSFLFIYHFHLLVFKDPEPSTEQGVEYKEERQYKEHEW